MAEGVLAQWLRAAYPPFRKAVGLEPWFLPEHQMGALMDEMRDEGAIKLAGPVLAAAQAVAQLEQLGRPGMIDDRVWQQGIRGWGPIRGVSAGIEALLMAGERIRALGRQGVLEVEPKVICRALAALFLAPLVPSGEELASKLAMALGSGTTAPGPMIAAYVAHLARGSEEVILSVDAHIEGEPKWQEWAEELLNYAMEFPLTPRVIAVTPPFSSVMTDGLTLMLKEVKDDGPGRDPAAG